MDNYWLKRIFWLLCVAFCVVVPMLVIIILRISPVHSVPNEMQNLQDGLNTALRNLH